MVLLFLLTLFSQDHSIDTSMTVNYRSVVVRALDKEGEPVRHLDKNHFQLEVNGKPVTEFDLLEQDFSAEMGVETVPQQDESAETATTPTRRTLALFIDATFLRVKMFKETKLGLHQVIDGLGPNDLVRLYYGDRGLKALTPFTQDKDALKKVVDDLEFKPFFQARLHEIEYEMREQNEDYWEADRANQDLLKRENAKSMIKKTAERRLRLFESQLKTQANFLRAVRQDLKRHEGARAILMFSGGGVNHSDHLQTFNQAARSLNHAEIPLHVISFNRKKDKGTEGNELEGAFMSVSQMNSLAHAYAQETGGEIVNVGVRKSLSRKIRRLVKATSHQYLLAFYAEEEAKTIKLTYVGPEKVELKYGKHPGRKVDLDLNDTQPKDAFETHLVYGEPKSDLDVTWESRLFRDQQGIHRIVVFGEINEALPAEGGVQVGFTVLDDQGKVLDLRRSSMTTLNGAFRDLLVCAQRPAMIRYAARNGADGRENIYVETLPPAEPNGHCISDIVLGQPRSVGSVPLHFQENQDIEAPLQHRRLDPFLVDGRLMSAGMTHTFAGPEVLTAFFFLENATQPLSGYKLGCRATAGDRVYELPVKPVIVKRVDQTTYQILAELDVVDMPAKEYELEIFARHGEREQGHGTRLVLGPPASN